MRPLTDGRAVAVRGGPQGRQPTETDAYVTEIYTFHAATWLGLVDTLRSRPAALARGIRPPSTTSSKPPKTDCSMKAGCKFRTTVDKTPRLESAFTQVRGALGGIRTPTF